MSEPFTIRVDVVEVSLDGPTLSTEVSLRAQLSWNTHTFRHCQRPCAPAQTSSAR